VLKIQKLGVKVCSCFACYRIMSVCAAAEVLMNCLNSFPASLFDLYDEDPEARRTCYYTRTYTRLSRFVPARGKDNKCASRDTSSWVLFERGTKDRQPFSVCKTLRCFKLSFGSCAPFGQQTKATTECSPIPLALITPIRDLRWTDPSNTSLKCPGTDCIRGRG